MTRRAVIVARIRPGAEDEVARIFADSDATDLPRLAGVRHRSLFVFGDVYLHLMELEDGAEVAGEEVRNHPLFREISRRLQPYIEPYDPVTWRGPSDALAHEFYAWDRDE